jgi:hypothetical protein
MKTTKFLFVMVVITLLALSTQSCTPEEIQEVPETQNTGDGGNNTVKS